MFVLETELEKIVERHTVGYILETLADVVLNESIKATPNEHLRKSLEDAAVLIQRLGNSLRV